MYELLQKLGGYDIPSRPVHIKDLIILCKMEYPEVYEDCYFSTALGRLRQWGYISYHYGKREYTIIDEYPEPNICNTPITEKDLIRE